MNHDNEEFTTTIRWYRPTLQSEDKTVSFSGTPILQQKVKCWNAAEPQKISYEWRTVPIDNTY